MNVLNVLDYEIARYRSQFNEVMPPLTDLIEARAAVAELIEAANIMERCAFVVSRGINPRGYEWCISYLDEALPILRAALAKVQP